MPKPSKKNLRKKPLKKRNLVQENMILDQARKKFFNSKSSPQEIIRTILELEENSLHTTRTGLALLFALKIKTPNEKIKKIASRAIVRALKERGKI
jgi:hypothetical protein